ncbi:hypothetical protein DICA4_F28128 [Diutina catenulata]
MGIFPEAKRSPKKATNKKRGVYVHGLSERVDGKCTKPVKSAGGADISDGFDVFDTLPRQMKRPITKLREFDENDNESSDGANESPTKKPLTDRLKVADQEFTAPSLPKLDFDEPSAAPEVEKEVNGIAIPPAYTKEQLDKELETHFDAVTRVLDPEKAKPAYYEQARQIQQRSSHETIRTGDFYSIPWKDFYSGFIGHERQLYLGAQIYERVKPQLHRLHNKDKVLQYWTFDKYCAYVLANEVVIAMTKEIFKVNSTEEAIDIIKATTDYGCTIADNVEFDEVEHV